MISFTKGEGLAWSHAQPRSGKKSNRLIIGGTVIFSAGKIWKLSWQIAVSRENFPLLVIYAGFLHFCMNASS